MLCWFWRPSSTLTSGRNPRPWQSLVCLLPSHLSFYSSLFFNWHLQAFLLCAENSFWYKSRCGSFCEAFELAVKSFVTIGPGRRGEDKLKILGNWPASEDKWKEYQSSLIRILLEHRLRMFNNTFLSFVSNLLLLQHARNKLNFQLPYSVIVLHSPNTAARLQMNIIWSWTWLIWLI